MDTPVPPLDPAKALGITKLLLTRLEQRMGHIPPSVLLVAHSSNALRGYLSFFGALRSGGLPARFSEQIALLVSEITDCEYGLAEHEASARVVGVSEADIRSSRRGRSSTPKIEAGLRFARALVWSRGHVSDDELRLVREAGYTDGQIVEIIGHVALNTFINYVTNATRLPASAARSA
ncbi:MAG TPA: carboxymuconolactone decarboxylase family protein [Gemmatimonadales bacterium]|nr:carboxymuconolactone decarboxylase family protein [Gemmatimonadales bacterium]